MLQPYQPKPIEHTKQYFGTTNWTMIVTRYVSREDGVWREIIYLQSIYGRHRKRREFAITRKEGKIEYIGDGSVPKFVRRFVEKTIAKL